MNIFKFGGASVKDAESVKNLAGIVRSQQSQLIVVISAMGKTTNLLEDLCEAWFNRKERTHEIKEEFHRYHREIAHQLFNRYEPAYIHLEKWFTALEQILAEEPSLCYDYEYDRIISFGELLSTSIVSDYLESTGLHNEFVDIRKYLITDQNYRNANINLELSEELCREKFDFRQTDIYITQGFIAGTRTSQTTTLGREGSDYTAALLANLLDGETVTIWKDVPGVMDADPKLYDKATVIDRMSYKEAIELSHFGAKVIHPKTIKPLQNKQIPLHVKSFLYPEAGGTEIREIDERLDLPPIYIHKTNQLLLTLTPRDFSFIAEDKLSLIFSVLAKYRLKLNLMQNSAISFSFCIDNHPAILNDFINDLRQDFEVLYNKNVELITIRHYTEEAVREIIRERQILVEQRSRITAQFILPKRSEE